MTAFDGMTESSTGNPSLSCANARWWLPFFKSDEKGRHRGLPLQPRRSFSLILFLGTCLLLPLSGCSFLGIRSNFHREGIILGMRDQARSNKLSRESMEVLYRENLLETYQKDPEEAFRLLVSEVLKSRKKQQDTRLLYTAAEFANVLAERKTPLWHRRPIVKVQGHPPEDNPNLPASIEDLSTSKQDLLTYYNLATYLSSAYLAVAVTRIQTESFNPHFRMACELYNYSLEQNLRWTLDYIPFNPKAFYRLNSRGGAIQARFKLVGFDWKEDDIHELLPCMDYEPREINLSSRRQGLGVPMIGLRYNTTGQDSNFYPPVCAFPVTALFIPSEKTFNFEATETQDTIHLVNPWNQETMRVGNADIPVEADLSTPLNYMLTKTGFDMGAWSGLIARDEKVKGSIFQIQPHRQDRIPVILCHGLFSSALPWESLTNGLQDDPWIRQHYEFWFMQYPTGKNLLGTSAFLRQELLRMRKSLDPQGTNLFMNHMVFIGHSMGGLVGRLLTLESGNAFWNMVWSVPANQLDLDAEERAIMERTLIFKRLPFIQRMIFMGTPHQGSPVAEGTLGWIGTHLVEIPKTSKKLLTSIGDRNKQYARMDLSSKQTSFTQIRPDSPLLQALNSLPPSKEIIFHNIMGDIYGGEEPGDGYVSVASAKFPRAISEITVPAEHTQLHGYPLSVKEISRILHLHYDEVRQSLE